MRYSIALIMMLAMVAFVANAQPDPAVNPPPAHGSYAAGWGMNPTNWNHYSGSYNSGIALYDPLGGGGGGAWYVGWDPLTYITYAPITLELWIEMYMIQTYYYTSYQWHRLGNAAETITFTIDGTCQSNNGQYIILEAGVDPMTHLYFRENIFGGTSTGIIGSADLPISWEYQWGNGLVIGQNIHTGWTAYTPNPNVQFVIEEPCDHWYQFKGTFTIPYHHPDGYYSLEMTGCPTPLL